MQQTRQLVYVGMSGGVDSSVSAALLKEAGYEVRGIFIKVWSPEFLLCTSKEDRIDAMRVAAHLEIPFETWDLTEEYKREVVDYLIEEYRAGRTPNPDVMCNEKIKFGIFFSRARKEGAEFIATGHYARVGENETSFSLLRGVDSEKDQTYFLWRLTQKHLEHTFFPVGGYKKAEVRTLAEHFKLPTATKKDSQGLCFIGELNIRDFLKQFIETSPGRVLNEQGEVIGTHEGAFFYTKGQRHGFTVTASDVSKTPLYVVQKDITANTITVSPKNLSDFAKQRIQLLNANWISNPPVPKKEYEAQTRYRGERHPIRMHQDSVEFTKAPPLVSAGQSLVVYDGHMCLGGGIIES